MPVPLASGAATSYVFPAVSVTDTMFEVVLFRPTTTMFVLPPVCADGYGTATVVWSVCGVALLTWTNAGVAGVTATP